MEKELVVVIDFGGQYNQLVARRVRECNVYCEIYSYKTDLNKIKAMNPKGIILTGGPASCYEPGAATCSEDLFHLGVPVLGLCYGAQLMTHVLGGKVERAAVREYGKTEVKVDRSSKLFSDVSENTICWMSHFDYISKLAPGFRAVAITANCPVAAAECVERGLYAIQFHPEVLHTVEGSKMLYNFVRNICGCCGDWKMDSFVEESIKAIREKVGNGKVLCALSGGVDSSVAALLLKRAGHEVIGVFMKNWEEKDDNGVCTSETDWADVRAVCERIDIPYYSVNFVKEYYDRVFSYFLDEYRRGRTPNPDVLCNREIKFKAFLDFAMKLGADRLATGHFCQLGDAADGKKQLLRGVDNNKDQSYFLYMLGQNALEKAMFPVGHLTKAQVREIAEEAGLANSRKKDSTGVCFIGERHFKPFLQQFLPAQPGNMRTLEGKVVGRHDGLMYYTLGQRRGLGIGGAGNGERWFVLAKDMERNELIVTQGADHPLLYSKNALGTDATWISGEAPAGEFDCTCKYRYRQPDQAVHVSVRENGQVLVTAKERQRAVTPGQSMVFYQGAVCLGGAICDTVLDAGQVG